MRRADLKVGFACNNNCRHCVIADKRRLLKAKPLETIRTELLQARERGCEEVVLTGGEPTIRKDILDIVAEARTAGFAKIQIQTNGRMISHPPFCRNLVDAGANDFVVAVHGHRADLHEYLTAGRHSFVQSLGAIRNLKALGQHVAVNVVVTKPNHTHLASIARLLARVRADQFQFAFVHPLGNAQQNFASIVPRMTLIEPYIKAGLDEGRKAGLCVMTEAIPYCFMRGYEEFIAERVIPDTTIFESDYIIEDYTSRRLADGKSKGPRCTECKFNPVCEGPWKEYPEQYGWDEFRPVTN